MIDWLFRNRRTGGITVAQAPNLALGIFLAAAALRWVLSPDGTAGTVLDVIASTALLWWALDEVVRGVNPFRRGLGGIVLAAEVVLLLR